MISSCLGTFVRIRTTDHSQTTTPGTSTAMRQRPQDGRRTADAEQRPGARTFSATPTTRNGSIEPADPCRRSLRVPSERSSFLHLRPPSGCWSSSISHRSPSLQSRHSPNVHGIPAYLPHIAKPTNPRPASATSAARMPSVQPRPPPRRMANDRRRRARARRPRRARRACVRDGHEPERHLRQCSRGVTRLEAAGRFKRTPARATSTRTRASTPSAVCLMSVEPRLARPGTRCFGTRSSRRAVRLDDVLEPSSPPSRTGSPGSS